MDLEAVRELGSSLSVVAGEFENANANSDRIAGTVGHEGLAHTIKDFAHKWDDTRKGMTDNLKALARTATQVADAFTSVDQDLATAIEGDQ